MGKNKKNGANQQIPLYRTKEERKKEVVKIMEKLSELQLTVHYDPIRQLFLQLQKYLNDGERIKINIPFPMINKRIKGVLAINLREEVWVKLEEN